MTTVNQANCGQSAKIMAAAIFRWGGLKPNQLMVSLSGGIVASILGLVSPAQALQVQVTPANPELGDTLSVIIQVNSSSPTPTVSVLQKNYPAFPMGNNRFRALLPTTPLEKAGARQIQVAGDGQVQKLSVQVRSRNFPTQSITLPPGKDSVGSDAEFEG